MQAAAKNTYPSGKDGFTLVELVISMTLMAIVFTAAFGSYFLGMRIIEDAREQVRASQIIQSELERLRTRNWSQLVSTPPFEYFTPQGNFVQQYAQNYIAYRYLFDVPGYPQKWVVVVVQWKNSRGMWTRQLFNTVFTKDGLNDYYYRDI